MSPLRSSTRPFTAPARSRLDFYPDGSCKGVSAALCPSLQHPLCRGAPGLLHPWGAAGCPEVPAGLSAAPQGSRAAAAAPREPGRAGQSVPGWGKHRVHRLRLLIIERSISLFLIKYKDYLTVIITTRWLRIKGAASKACLREAKAGSASFIINHQEFLFS